MKSTRWLAALCGAVLLVPTTAAAGSESAASDRAKVVGSFNGIDGQVHESSPSAVRGLDGELFFGPEMDVACGFGDDAEKAMRTMTSLTRIIERSGRRVIWTGAPGKASVLPHRVDPAQLPHGSCDELGLAEQRKMVDTYQEKDPSYLPLRKALARDRRQVFFKTDPHWTTVGGTVFAKALANRLDPRIGKRQRYTYGTESRVGVLNEFLGDNTPETVRTAMPDTVVRTREAKDSVSPYDGYPGISFDYAWRSSPAKLTYPGRTLLLGDSFTCIALPAMLPIFQHGRFMWLDHVDLDDVIKAIKQSDTVVIEVLQTFLPIGSIVTTKSFRADVRRALR